MINFSRIGVHNMYDEKFDLPDLSFARHNDFKKSSGLEILAG